MHLSGHRDEHRIELVFLKTVSKRSLKWDMGYFLRDKSATLRGGIGGDNNLRSVMSLNCPHQIGAPMP
jgi:hypothetical protein